MDIRVLIYVDDLIICWNNSEAIQWFKKYLGDCFHMKDLGKLKYFLGIEMVQNKEGFVLTHIKYSLDIVKDTGLLGSKAAEMPMEQNHHLASDKSPYVSEPARYRRLVGRLYIC